MTGMPKFVYRCPVCKKDLEVAIEPSAVPWCQGPDNTHSKAMQFIAEKSSYTPDYNRRKKK